MPLELRQEHVLMQVDGDVLEIFRSGMSSERVPLSWLAVQVEPSIKGRLVIRIKSTPGDAPLYEVIQKAKTFQGTLMELLIRPEDEPFYRQFFTQVAQLCGRLVVP